MTTKKELKKFDISIVTPSFNQGKFIEKTIKSVIDQNYNTQHIIFDGCSSDNTKDILERYKEYIQYTIEPDKGQTDAINKGLKLCEADIVGWLNSDDIYLKDTFKTVLKKFSENPEIDIIYGSAEHITEDDKFIENYPTRSFDYEILKEYCFICQPAVFFRKSIFLKYGYLNEKLDYCMDYDLWLRFSKLGAKFKYIKTKFACSRFYKDNKTLGHSDKVHREIAENFYELFNDIPPKWIFALSNFEINQNNPFKVFYLLIRSFINEYKFHKKIRFKFLISPFNGSFERWSNQSGSSLKKKNIAISTVSRILNLIFLPFFLILKLIKFIILKMRGYLISFLKKLFNISRNKD